MNRFHQDKKAAAKKMLPAVSVLVLLSVGAFFVKEAGDLTEDHIKKQKILLSDALNRSIVQCYALEGRYPKSISYLEKNYGIVYDKEKFFIDYEIVGANIKPEATVYERER